MLASLSTLELVARSAVEGFFQGLHRSPRFGFSQEFAEYKAYAEGDDPRFVDWNVFARTDRAYIKRFLGEDQPHRFLTTEKRGFFSRPFSPSSFNLHEAFLWRFTNMTRSW